ncbi:MAG: S26 family signal peptidase [Hyphomonadaceae bacterium]|nr:S26 family signal peptidase [Hyphomonadaceae bacterium]
MRQRAPWPLQDNIGSSTSWRRRAHSAATAYRRSRRSARIPAKSAYLIKFIIGVTGDRVCRFGGRVFVNGAVRARAFSRDRRHRHMPVWQGCYRLASGQVFVLAEDPDSFDSRYFGPLSDHHIIGRGVRVW